MSVVKSGDMAKRRTPRKTSSAPAANAQVEQRRHYGQLLSALKKRVRSAQLRAGLAVNRELVLLYWEIGKDILENQERLGWGAKVVDRLSRDLHQAFPLMRGFSPRNLKYMRALAEAYPEAKFVQQDVAQIPWGHNVRILDRVRDQAIREFYIRRTIEYGWSRDVLEMQIESQLHEREGRAVTNFPRALPPAQSDLAQQVLKDPYNFDFLTLGEEAQERDLEEALLHHLRDFLLELGVGFSFVGSQYRIEVAGEDFSIDLLFYHLRLRCFVVIDLKMRKFQPEFAGKMNFYLSAMDDLLRHRDDRPSIGIILCKSRDAVVAEYALRDMKKPIGVAGFKLTEALPAELKGNLPTIEELEDAMDKAAAPAQGGKKS